eukprot:12928804-Alexandrium_andersonii.AAC.1
MGRRTARRFECLQPAGHLPIRATADCARGWADTSLSPEPSLSDSDDDSPVGDAAELVESP